MNSAADLALILCTPRLILYALIKIWKGDRVTKRTRKIMMLARARFSPTEPTLEKIRTRMLGSVLNWRIIWDRFSYVVFPSMNTHDIP